MTNNASPYAKAKKSDWIRVTNELVEAHPLNEKEIVDFSLAAWENLFNSSIGRHGLKIGEHDLDIKLKKISGFLEQGHKVKIVIFYRGRELAHKDIGFTLANKVIEKLSETIAVDQPPQLAGKQLIFVIRSNGPAKKEPKGEE